MRRSHKRTSKGQNAQARANGEEISKKDLLREAGISYGQFYRWKRMGLIPEAWFRRRSTFTGQETFLPRREILQRIERIQSMRAEASLEEIAAMLSPDLSDRLYGPEEVARLGRQLRGALRILPHDLRRPEYTFMELVSAALSARLTATGHLTEKHVGRAAAYVLSRLSDLSPSGDRRFTVADVGGTVALVLHEGACIFDESTAIVASYSVNEVIEELKVSLRDLLE